MSWLRPHKKSNSTVSASTNSSYPLQQTQSGRASSNASRSGSSSQQNPATSVLHYQDLGRFRFLQGSTSSVSTPLSMSGGYTYSSEDAETQLLRMELTGNSSINGSRKDSFASAGTAATVGTKSKSTNTMKIALKLFKARSMANLRKGSSSPKTPRQPITPNTPRADVREIGSPSYYRDSTPILIGNSPLASPRTRPPPGAVSPTPAHGPLPLSPASRMNVEKKASIRQRRATVATSTHLTIFTSSEPLPSSSTTSLPMATAPAAAAPVSMQRFLSQSSHAIGAGSVYGLHQRIPSLPPAVIPTSPMSFQESYSFMAAPPLRKLSVREQLGDPDTEPVDRSMAELSPRPVFNQDPFGMSASASMRRTASEPRHVQTNSPRSRHMPQPKPSPIVEESMGAIEMKITEAVILRERITALEDEVRALKAFATSTSTRPVNTAADRASMPFGTWARSRAASAVGGLRNLSFGHVMTLERMWEECGTVHCNGVAQNSNFDDKYTLAAIRIQNAWRGYKVRRIVREYHRQHMAASVIQGCWRRLGSSGLRLPRESTRYSHPFIRSIVPSRAVSTQLLATQHRVESSLSTIGGTSMNMSMADETTTQHLTSLYAMLATETAMRVKLEERVAALTELVSGVQRKGSESTVGLPTPKESPQRPGRESELVTEVEVVGTGKGVANGDEEEGYDDEGYNPFGDGLFNGDLVAMSGEEALQLGLHNGEVFGQLPFGMSH
ncbi:hypothetical protein G7K_1646-t1 [Saitoella complicata NRRL Y-17804]|uniref:Uncharacterized protein n=1 Tax=Saitoella complicata (strain BCRC 22490 / CBS 7301 / JCM 7358 / NBRC 10748 / NRRL Y-17804) TaxID=698492 RepID=A0A0E9NCB6_SAICN|nr:hypothetical protein G7K_1646-t1 [Saitoella complicata NRRL Y-17804]